MIGQTISHYKILEKLGEGGMGVVYKAQDITLDRLVAIKFLPSEYSSDSDAKKRFIREAKAASALDHSNICTIYEIDETPDGQLFLVMALYEGSTLADVVKQGPLDIDKALDIAIQVAQGLRGAHEKGIIHRDIKSSNIVLTEKGQAKIMDFGLAKTVGMTMLTKSGATVGTVPYMSPEQARGEKVDHRTDIWSLGVVLYEMLTGRLPFESPYSEAVIYSILNEEPKPFSLVRSDVPTDVENIVRKCLQKNRDQRYQRVDELIADLRRVKTESDTKMPSRKILQSIPFRRRNWYLVGGAGLVLALLLYVFLPLSTTKDAVIRSIAVLPLDNLSRDPEQEYFADGMTEALITELAKIGSLRVISRTSVMRYKETQKSVSEIARELSIDAVVEGSVLRSGDRVRITAQILHATTERHLWAESYERSLGDVLSLQNEIVTAITREVKLQLTPHQQLRLASPRPVNAEAYELYLRGRERNAKLTRMDLETAIKFYELALSKDSTFALAYVGIGRAWSGLQQMGFAKPAEAQLNMRRALARALALDSTLAEVYYARASLATWSDWNWKTAEEDFKKADSLNSNHSEGQAAYAHFLQIMKRPTEAMEHIRRALAADPFNPQVRAFYGTMLTLLQRHEEGLEQVRKVKAEVPNMPMALNQIPDNLYFLGRYDEALAEERNKWIMRNDEEIVQALERGAGIGGYRTSMQVIADLMAERAKKSQAARIQIAAYYIKAGDLQNALEWLERAYEARDPNMPYLAISPMFDSLRTHPRFQALLRRMNFPTPESDKVGNLAPTNKRMTEIPAERHNSVAVLPFKNISPDPDQEYFCEGMTEAIITDLARIGELIVMSPAAVARYKGKSTNPIEIGRELRVQYLVEGSVQRMGTALRVSAQLTNTETGAQVWGDRFDRTILDVFKLQDDISRRIVGALQLKVGPKAERSRPAQNFDAYDTFLRGRFYLRKQNVKEVDRAVALLEQAVQLDPNYAPALTSLGMAYIQKSFYDEPLKREWEERAFIIIEKALLIDQNLAEAYVAKGNLLWTPANRFPHEKAIAAYRRAIELNPNLDEAHEWLGLVYYHVGLMDAGLEECRKALQINPSSGFAQSRLGINLLYSGRYEEALTELRKVPEGFSPQIVPAQIAVSLSYLGRMNEAKAALEEGLRQLPDDPFLLSTKALLLAKERRTDEAIQIIHQAEKREKTYLGHFHHAAYNIGSAYALMGKTSLAVEWLRKAAENGFPCYPKYEQDSNLSHLRQDPTFRALMSDLGREWQKYKAML